MSHPTSYRQEENPLQMSTHEGFVQYQRSVDGSFQNIPQPNTRLIPPDQQMFNVQPPSLPANVHDFSLPPPMGQLPIPPTPRPLYNLVDSPQSKANNQSYYNIQGSSFHHPPPHQPPQQVITPSSFFLPNNNSNFPGSCPSRVEARMPVDFAMPPPLFHTQNMNSHPRTPFLPGHAGPLQSCPSIPVATSNSMTKKERGAELLKGWLQRQENMKKTTKRPDSSKSKVDSLKMWECVQQLSEVKRLLSNMSSQIDSMDTTLTTADKKTWEEGSWTIEGYKNQLKAFEPFLEKSVQCDIMKGLEQRKAKRGRLKRGRKWKAEQQEIQKEEWHLKNRKIDEWQEIVMKKFKEESMIAKRKAKADRTLSKVTKEIQDANKLIETMTALQKLRLIRRDAAEKRGDADLGESRQTFEQKIVDMIRLVKAQLEHYKDEEKKLKTIIKSEVEENARKQEEIHIEAERVKQNAEEAELNTLIFGSQGEIERADQRYPFVQYYKQAEQNLQAFLQIRHEWDSYCVPKTSAGVSSIPSTWVVPTEPSSSIWASAQI